MEIIKEIKSAEKEAKLIIEKAQAKATAVIEDAKKQRGQKLEDARLQRRKIIDAAVKKASAEAEKEVAVIRGKANKIRDEIAGKSGQSISKESKKVLGFIKTFSEE